MRPPTVGVLWTPGYWGRSSGVYVWNAGYWGPRIGYYGGINYGYGYVGVGYAGGYRNGGVFSYNRTVNNFGGVTINNTYNKTVINNNVTQVSYNGGTGGTTAQPTAHELAAAKDTHTPPTALQTQHQTAASTNKALLASVNHGSPAVAATSRPASSRGKASWARRPPPATVRQAATPQAQRPKAQPEPPTPSPPSRRPGPRTQPGPRCPIPVEPPRQPIPGPKTGTSRRPGSPEPCQAGA